MLVVLVTGGSGYLGQFLVGSLCKTHKVFYTYNSTPVEFSGDQSVEGFKVDFASGNGLEECLKKIGTVDAVVNCAAVAQPGTCEKEPEKARAVNVPSKLIDSLSFCKSAKGGQPMLVHISTDQVYDGSKAFWCESDVTRPINVYGKTKVLAEQLIQSKWANHVILRSSLIYGGRSSPLLDFVVNSLRSGKSTKFFWDEYRCPIYAADVAAIVSVLIQTEPANIKHRLINLGGPDRLSRVDMAKLVAAQCKLDADLIQEVPSASVPRAAASPLDISMDVTRLQELGVAQTSFSAALDQIFAQRQ